MGITAPIAGAYTATLNPKSAGAVALGYTRQGYNLNFVNRGERLEETDLFGLSLVDIVGRGMQMTIDTVCKIYAAATRDAIFPWTATFGRVYAAATPIGQLASTSPDILILTSVAGTTAAASPATLTAPSVKLSPDNNVGLIFSSVIREVPLRWDVLITESASVGTLFSTT